MEIPRETTGDCCFGCVYYPPNLPPAAYAPDDLRMLQAKTCSFDFVPRDAHCIASRKTSCALVDLRYLDTASKP